jgi:hypothetical protein
MEKPLIRRLYERAFFDVPVNPWRPPLRTYTITETALSVAMFTTLFLRMFTDLPGLGSLTLFLFLAWLLAQRIWLRSILKREGRQPPGQ